MKKISIIHLPTTTGNNSLGLSNGEKKLGFNSCCFDINNTYLDYKSDIKIDKNISIIEKYAYIFKLIQNINKNFDIIHFNYGSSLLNRVLCFQLVDLCLYKNKVFFVTYNGSDCRQKKINGITDLSYNKLAFILKKYRIRKFVKYEAHFYTVNPDLLRYLPRNCKFLPYTIASWNNLCAENYRLKKKGLINIVHAPTNKKYKGTQYIINAINRINKKKKIINLILVENVSNEEAIRIYKQADLVIDQLLIGWYGAFSVEAMKLKKPVMCYINEDDAQLIDNKQFLNDCLSAIININISNIEQKLNEVINNRYLLKKHSDLCYNFVEKWHNPDNVAKMVIEDYMEALNEKNKKDISI